MYVKVFIVKRYINFNFKELHNDQEYYWLTTYRAGVACVEALRRALAEGQEKGELATTVEPRYFELG